jgi:L-fucose isomerase-like protein
VEARFGFIPVASVLVEGPEALDHIIGEYAVALTGIGGTVTSVDDIGQDLPVFYLLATGGTESKTLELVERRQKAVPGEPVFILAHPGNNSLPAALEVLAKLHQDGLKGRIIYLNAADDAVALAAIHSAAIDLGVRRTLHAAKVGLVGAPSDWLVASMPSGKVVNEVWGPEVYPINLGDLVGRIASVTDEAAGAAADALVGAATGCVEPTREDLLDVARVSQALKQLVVDRRLNALTVRCFDLVLSMKTTGCFALAELTDAGVIAGCEGDIVTTVGLMWARLMTGATPWMANPAQLDEAANALWLAHCTVPRSMVESYRLRSHFESGLGVGIQGVLPNSPVTLVRIGGTRMERIWIAEGAIVRSGDAENLCRTQAYIELSDGSVSDLLTEPLGNHIVLVPGHHAARLRSWWETMI